LTHCNRGLDEETLDARIAYTLGRVDYLLQFRNAGIPVFLNLDPRGYALKIDDAWMRANDARLHQDWGGYGILAPDLSEE